MDGRFENFEFVEVESEAENELELMSWIAPDGLCDIRERV